MTILLATRAAVANFVARRRAALRSNELGQNLMEYTGLVILVAGVVALIMSTDVLDQLRDAFVGAVQSVLDEAPNSGGGGDGGGGDGDGT